VTTIKVLL